jgi:putative colanic acid biosynthesis acetyltransferase WcaF
MISPEEEIWLEKSFRAAVCASSFKAAVDLKIYDNSDFDRGAPRWKEVLWILLRGLFLQNPFPWPSEVRVALLRAFGARIGQGVVVRENVNVSFPWRLTIGDHVWIGEDVGILSLAQVTIESNVCISQRAYLCTGSHDFRAADFTLVTSPITIRSGSWIAAGAIVLPGVEIGPGSLVTAGSVVNRNVPPNTTVRGNPATVKAK